MPDGQEHAPGPEHEHAATSSFVRLLQAKKAKIDRQLRDGKCRDSVELETLVGYAASATNGVSDKPQAMSEILFMLVLMFASDKLSAEEAHGKAISDHAAGCLAKGRIENIEKAIATLSAAKPAKENSIVVAREAVAALPDGPAKQALTAFVAAVAPLYAIRHILIVAILSPNTLPIIAAVMDAMASANGG